MKLWIKIVLTVLIVVTSLCFASCGNNDDNKTTPNNEIPVSWSDKW